MPYEVINKPRSRSLIRIVDEAAVTVQLAELETGVSGESVSGASINHIISTSNSAVAIYRGDSTSGNLVFTTDGTCDLPLAQYDISIGNTATANIHVTTPGTGTVILSVTKLATYDETLI